MIEKATKNFGKSQSQFMDNMFTVSQPTELRSARQILAEINKSKMALDEAYFNVRKKEIEIARKKSWKKQLEIAWDNHIGENIKPENQFDRDLLEVEIQELGCQIKNTMGYVEGAIRKISAYMTQYQNILAKYGKTEFTEEDFEKDEERYHIMKAFEQGLCAARSHGGVIDEGNHIYFYQIGISGTAAQKEVSDFLMGEGKILASGKMPAHGNTVNWMNAMADKYTGCAIDFAQRKGMTLIDKDSVI